jgi:hypothetical protein
MSADNGVYVAKFPTLNSGVEYRVAHLQNIEELDYNSIYDIPEDVVIAYRNFSFANSPIFLDEQEAIDYAYKLEESIVFTEYGVCSVEYNTPITMTERDAEKIIIDYWGDFYDDRD